MANINLPNYDPCRSWIKKRRDRNVSWEVIQYAQRADQQQLDAFLTYQKDFEYWPADLDVSVWFALVESEKSIEAHNEEVAVRHQCAMLIDASQDSDVVVPEADKSSWQLYKKHLLSSGFNSEAVDEVERATIGTLRRLNSNTTETGPIKGLVIGNVQSGKTANMAALMAMAADYGWNMFIVLSGTIENLRKQTQSRLQRDLNHPGNLVWIGLDHLSLKSPIGQRAQDLYFDTGIPNRYFTVCLKNTSRLKNMIRWLQADANKQRQMKILVIDDEADQAGINTAKLESKERKAINKLIVNLVDNKTYDSKECASKYRAMNYISYTATPYANFLNEAGRESLYPRNFIRALQASDEYFGPQQLFGAELSDDFHGMNIVRKITPDELTTVLDIHDGAAVTIPESFQNAFCWFLCSASAMRYQGYKKPISMLIHTSQRQAHHDEIHQALVRWIGANSVADIVDKCKSLWESEQEEFSKEIFFSQYPTYGRSADDVPDYPDFSEIESGIHLLLSEITPIHLDDDEQMCYHAGIHLCIDNCAYNGKSNDGDFVRLAYPSQDMDPYPSPAPAFIVIGGSTLSRGLTIEGLVSTYFCRNVSQADTLMQMGRWFGYRRNYELLPRLWLTDAMKTKFEFLSDLDMELRNDLVQYMIGGKDPSQYGPRVKNTPKVSWLRITAKNRMQGAAEIEMDFSGTSTQTRLFPEEKDKLDHNLSVVSNFISTLHNGRISPNGNSVVFEDVDFQLIHSKLLKDYISASRGHVFNEMGAFCDWINTITEEGNLNRWNVILAGSGSVGSHTSENSWSSPLGTIGKITRSRKKIAADYHTIDIGVLRDPKDLVADVDRSKLSERSRNIVESGKGLSARVHQIRAEAELEKTPQVIIYIVDKNSKAKRAAGDDGLRTDLNAASDLAGLCITVPGSATGNARSNALRIKIDVEPEENDDNTEEE